MYHVNYEGKIYPCRAKVMKCPYGWENHAKTKEELYLVTMKKYRTGEVSMGVKSELNLIGRIMSLEPMSKELANSKAPVEMIVASLDHAIKTIEEDEEGFLDGKIPHALQHTYKRGAQLVRNHYKNMLNIPKWVPQEIALEGYKLFKELDGGRVARDATYGEKGVFLESDIKELKDLRGDFSKFQVFTKYKLTKENKEKTLNFLKREFNKFSQHLNASKQITKPVFFGSFEQAKQDIKTMDEMALMATYDDLMNPEADLWKNVAEADNFKYTPRSDLDSKANAKLAEWYKMNEKIANSRRQNEGTRILLAMEVRKEIDARGYLTGDFTPRK